MVEKPSKEEYKLIAEWLQRNVTAVKRRSKFLLHHNVEYFTGTIAVDALQTSPWSVCTNGSEAPKFTTRQDVIDFLDQMLKHKLFYRAEKVPVNEQTNLIAGQRDIEQFQDYQREKKKMKIRLEKHIDQYFVDSLDAYVWIYDTIPVYYWLFGFLLVIGAILFCMFSLWTSSDSSAHNKIFYKSGHSTQDEQFSRILKSIATKQWAKPEVDRQYTTGGSIVIGGGYSSDSQQVVSQLCYNATIASASAQQEYISLATALSYSEFENKLGVFASVSGRYWMFSADAKASYIRSLRDEDYSLSLNYYQYASNNIAVQLAGYGTNALTESGRGFYNDGNNKYFGLICGDHYINSYQQGALLTMGLNIKFSSSSVKKEFNEKADATYGYGIFKAAESVQSVVNDYRMSGSVTIQALQIGGEPSKLAKILNKDRTGQYYAMTCSLSAMTDCVRAASGLLDYVRDDFSAQYSFENNTGLTPLGIAFTQYTPIEYIGLTSVSLVTPEVEQYREELATRLKETDYYKQKIYPFLNNGYPVQLHANFISEAKSIVSKANNNVAVLMQAHGGAADCYNFPDRCQSVKAVIDSQLHNITSDLKFLEPMKYTYTTFGGIFYNTGIGKANSSVEWTVAPNNKLGQEQLVVAKVVAMRVEDDWYVYDIVYSTVIPVNSTVNPDLYEYAFLGSFNNSSMKYVGGLCMKAEGASSWKECWNRTEAKLISPFFFEAFNSTVH